MFMDCVSRKEKKRNWTRPVKHQEPISCAEDRHSSRVLEAANLELSCLGPPLSSCRLWVGSLAARRRMETYGPPLANQPVMSWTDETLHFVCYNVFFVLQKFVAGVLFIRASYSSCAAMQIILSALYLGFIQNDFFLRESRMIFYFYWMVCCYL
jgi:hypothetical protein